MVLVIDDKSDLGRYVIARNLARQYDFLHTAFIVSENEPQFVIDHRFIREINFYGVQFASPEPAIYRHENQRNVRIDGSAHKVPPHEEVGRLLDDFMGNLQEGLANGDPIELASYVLWRINWIHPFVQGNGRTARALSYFVLCRKLQMWLPGNPIIPEQIRSTREEYCALLSDADEKVDGNGKTDLGPIISYMNRLLTIQLQSTGA